MTKKSRRWREAQQAEKKRSGYGDKPKWEDPVRNVPMVNQPDRSSVTVSTGKFDNVPPVPVDAVVVSVAPKKGCFTLNIDGWSEEVLLYLSKEDRLRPSIGSRLRCERVWRDRKNRLRVGRVRYI